MGARAVHSRAVLPMPRCQRCQQDAEVAALLRLLRVTMARLTLLQLAAAAEKSAAVGARAVRLQDLCSWCHHELQQC